MQILVVRSSNFLHIVVWWLHVGRHLDFALATVPPDPSRLRGVRHTMRLGRPAAITFMARAGLSLY